MKKIVFGIATTMLFVGAGVFADNVATQKTTEVCPNHPGCVCNASAEATSQQSADHKGNCPYPNCICNH